MMRGRWCRMGACALVLAAGLAASGCAHLPFRGRGARALPVAANGPALPAPVFEAPAASAALPADEAGLLALLEREPRHTAALLALARLLHGEARHAEAAELLRVALAQPEGFRADERARLLSARALLHDALGEHAEARDAIASARSTSAREAGPAALYLGLRRGAGSELPALAREVAHESRGDAAALNNVGIARLRTGDVEGARRAFESALERDAALPGPSYNLAILEHWWKRDRAAAARHFARYWRLSHDDPDGLAAVFHEVTAADARAEVGR